MQVSMFKWRAGVRGRGESKRCYIWTLLLPLFGEFTHDADIWIWPCRGLGLFEFNRAGCWVLNSCSRRRHLGKYWYWSWHLLRWLNTVLAVCEYRSFAKSWQEKGCSSQAATWQVKNMLMKDFDWQVEFDFFWSFYGNMNDWIQP